MHAPRRHPDPPLRSTKHFFASLAEATYTSTLCKSLVIPTKSRPQSWTMASWPSLSRRSQLASTLWHPISNSASTSTRSRTPSVYPTLAEGSLRQSPSNQSRRAHGYLLGPREQGLLQPGSWSLSTVISGGVAPHVWLDLVVHPRRLQPITIPTTSEPTGTKRPRDEVPDSNKHKKASDGHYRQASGSVSHPLLELSKDETFSMTGLNCDDKYSLTYRKPVNSTPSSKLYAADYSRRSGQVAVVKSYRPVQDTVALAEKWLNEVKMHKRLDRHVSQSPSAHMP